ncbi:MAG: ATP-dependent helicase [Phycisphaerales bacterium]|nr:ATP-dependent helicase [Phycisphaerales bacterium]
MPAPVIQLSPPQKEVVAHRAGHMQVIACAGSGKTEAVSRRVAALIGEGVEPASIVAFTFTEKAAAELKDRIINRVAEVKGDDFKGRLAQMFVGTIHSYCFKLLQDHVPQYGNYDVLEPHRHAGLLSRETKRLCLDALGQAGHWAPIQSFAETVDVIGNELIQASDLTGTPLGLAYTRYLETLDRYRYLTFGLIIQKAVEALKDPAIFKKVHGPLKHLIVDEYQDINPAQEALIQRLGTAPVHICVVGDDDQSIYQWRGSQTSNILTFVKRYGAHAVTLAANRRSKAEIVDHAAQFAALIPGRLSKRMEAVRESDHLSVVPWSADTPADEAETVAAAIEALKAKGFRYRDIAILYRSVRTSAPPMIAALRNRGIPITCGGRTGLFMLPEIDVLGRTYVWLVDYDWRPTGFGQQSATVNVDDLVRDFLAAFGNPRPAKEIKKYLTDWKTVVGDERSPVNLVGDFYKLLNFLKVHQLDPDVPDHSARMGALARFSNILADFENVTRRGRWVTKDDGTREFTGGTNRGIYFYQRLANFMQHYARDAYEDFDGEVMPDVDAVDISTVHQAKGLEWPIVFMPALVDSRFPSRNAGKPRQWLLPDKVFPAASRARYEGGEDEERRLFYVAMTRARDALYVSHFRRQTNRAKPSRFLVDIFGSNIPQLTQLPLPNPPAVVKPDEPEKIAVSFSELTDFDECGFRYRLSTSLGFETQLVSELGYGRAIHHVLRFIAEMARTTGKVPTVAEVQKVLDTEFYLPFANKNNFDNMRTMADRMIGKYLTQYKDDLQRIWATERPFEMHLDAGTLSGRADVILEQHNGKPDSLAIVDYKTAKGNEQDAVFAFQLAVYAAAGRGEGLNVDAALLHHLDAGTRSNVDITVSATGKAVTRVEAMMGDLQTATYIPKPEKQKCKACEYRRLCRHAPVDPWDSDD